LNELPELGAKKKIRAEKKMSLITPSITPPIEGLSVDEKSMLIALRKGKT